MVDITDFLPKYPNIKQSSEELFNPYSDTFYESIYTKKEFYDERLPLVENFPDIIGTLMKHQKIIARFFSSHTMYDRLLLMHQMGSGKTCAAIAAIEQIKSEHSTFTGAMIFARGEGVLNNFINELVFKCTGGQYIPADYENLTELEKVHRVKKSIKDYYTLNTFETFAKSLSVTRDETIIQKYSDKIIVIDEVHNLRIQDKKEGLVIYNQFFRLCHLVKNSKILLMSGTPMKDSPEEVASVINLLLPLDQQLPTGGEFMSQFFDDNIKLKDSKIKVLKEKFKGRVSYLKTMRSDVKKIFVGSSLSGDLSHFIVDEDYMDAFQTKSYTQAYNRDKMEKGVYSYSRQAELFVFPDGSYGSAGFSKYIAKSAQNRAVLGEDGRKRKLFNYTLIKELRAVLEGKNDDIKLKKLEKYSSKYAATIRSILEAKKEGKSVFVYCEFVQGSGAILFSQILEIYGFSLAKGTEKDEKPRYAIITNKTATQKEIKNVIARFNQPDNMRGKIINVIIGSRVIGEGFSLSNIQQENILTPHWNYSETAQSIARGFRLGSHRALIAAGVTPEVKIYQRVSIPSDDTPSIDLEMYEISERKDILIKQVERLMKEASFDCALNYERNYITDQDGERECDYMRCNYTCDGVPMSMIENTIDNANLDYSTYQLYYASSHIKEIIERLVYLFRDRFRADLSTIIDYFPEYTAFELVTALRTIINESRIITNKYGFPAYLKEENNIFFLVDSLSVIGNYYSEYYTKNPNIKQAMPFIKIVNDMYIQSLPDIINKVFVVRNTKELQELIVKVPPAVQEILIESSLLARKKGLGKNENIRDLILTYFKKYYHTFNDVLVSSLLYDETGVLRCLEGNEWRDCDETYSELLGEEKSRRKLELETNPYGYYGQYNRETNTFCLRDVSNPITDDDQRKIKLGRNCVNWNRTELTHIMVDKLKVPISDRDVNFMIEKTKDELWKLIQANKYINSLYTKTKDQNKLSIDDLRRTVYWSTKHRGAMCDALKPWFEAKGLLEDNPFCGLHTKTKKK